MLRPSSWRWAAALVTLVACDLARGQGTSSDPVVTTSSGRLRGKFMDTRGGRTVQAFLGIPYAKPPVGELRFEPPKPIEPWAGERSADKYAKSCMQIIDPRGSEDCLYLDIYTPNIKPKTLLPVIVFIYGGSFDMGMTSGYTPEYYLDEDVLLVPVNYRLGLFGLLSTGDAVVPGNMGLKDQRCALRWLKDNIKFFGGDPNRVTINGQSAGSVSVHYLMTFAAHEGLFWAGIGQSGVSLCPWAFRPPEEVRKMVNKLAKLSMCPAETTAFVACLKAKPALDILMLYSTLYKNSMYEGLEMFTSYFMPLLGGVIEPECVKDRLVTGNPWQTNTSVPWLGGVNSKEALFILAAPLKDRTDGALYAFNSAFDKYFRLAANYQSCVNSGPDISSDVREFYMDSKPITRQTISSALDAMTDAFFIYSTYETALSRTNRDKSFVYFNDYIGDNQVFTVPNDARVGTGHSDDLYMFFPHPAVPVNVRMYDSEEDTRMSKALVKFWTNFASTLNPTPGNSSSIQWSPFPRDESYLYISPEGNFKMKKQFYPKRMGFWKSQPFPFRNDCYEKQPCRVPMNGNQTTFDYKARLCGQ